ncbi:MAG: hypothetical protein P9M12_00030 [Candidatus Aceula lacicola]|nr:hypothetical protein [Candidatus Aceula lacicola]
MENDDKKMTKISIVFEGREKVSSEKKKFIADMKELYQILFDARCSYEAWWICVAGEHRKKYWLLYFCYRDFFHYSAYSYLANMIVSLYKLYDSTQENSLSILNFINIGARSNLISRDSLKELRESKKEALKIWKKIKVIRNSLIAHQCNRMTRSGIYKLAKITPNQMKELTNLSLLILNKISVSLGQKKRFFDGLITEDMIKILTLLKRHTLIKKNVPGTVLNNSTTSK